MTPIKLTHESSPEQLKEVYVAPKGTIIKVDSPEYERVIRLINEGAPEGFETTEITPGTKLFTTYGPNHIVVTKNEK